MSPEPPSGGHDRPPDRAALDELRRVFGVESVDSQIDDDATAAEPSIPDEPYEFEIVEQDPLPHEPTPPSLADPPPPDPAVDEPAVDDPAVDDPADDGTDTAADPEIAAEPGIAAEPEIAVEPEIAAEPDTESVPATDPEPDVVASASVVRIDDYRPNTSIAGEPALAGVSEPDSERCVIAIEADDLPDAVYVEGSLETGGTGSIVFIEDSLDSDALTPESDRDLRRGIEPRMRERRVAVKRAAGRKRLKWALAILVVVLIAVGGLATLGSSLFAIKADQVTVTGAVYTDPEALQAVIDELVGTPVLVADTQAAERQLEQIPWVADAKVSANFPHAATIDIRERQAVATFQGPDGRYRVLDPEGRVLDVLDMYPFAYVLVGGPDPVDLEAGDFAPQGYVAAADLAKNLTGRVRGQVEQIETTANGSRLSMWLDDGTEVRFGQARDLFVKLVRLETLLAQDCERVPGPIDVSTDETTGPGCVES